MALIKQKQLAIANTHWDFTGASSLQAKTPTFDTHVATMGWVNDQFLANVDGLDSKESCRVASTANFASTFSSAGKNTLTASAVGVLTFDGVTVALNDRVLLKDQTSGSENGLWRVKTLGTAGVAGVLERTEDMYWETPPTPNAYTFVEEGAVSADKGFVLTTNGPITLNTSSLVFTVFNSSATSYTGGDGLLLTGTEFSVDFTVDKGLQIASGKLEIEINPTAGGLQAGASGLAILLDSTTFESGLEVGSTGLRINPINDSLVVTASGIKSAVPQTSDIALSVSSNVTANYTDSGLTITSTPANDSLVTVLVNGVGVEVGNGSKFSCDCWFSGDNGTTARTMGAITASDKMYWNAVIAYDLEQDDIVDFIYVTA